MEYYIGLVLASIENAFLAFIFCFILAKLFSIVVHGGGNKTILDEKICGEKVKLDKGLKVKRTKTKKKRVKFVDDVAVRKIDHFEGSGEPIKDFQSCEYISEKVEILDKSPEAVYGFEDERKDKESELMTSGERLKFVDDIVVSNIDHFEGSDEPIKDFLLCENLSEKVEILDKSLEAVHGFETEEKDKESELMTCFERLVDECDDEITLKEVKGDDYEGLKGSKDVRLLDEEAVEEKDEDAKFGEFCTANNEYLVASGLQGVVVGEGMKTDGIHDDNEFVLFNDGSDPNGAGDGERLAVNSDFSNKDLEREAVEERSEDTAIDADKVYGSSIQMPSGGLEDLIAGMKVKGEMEIASNDTQTPQNEERGTVSVKEDDVIGTGGIHDGNELILTKYRNDKHGAITGERLAANAEFSDKESEREVVEERDEDTAVDAAKVHESSIEMPSGGLEDLDVGVKVESDVELASDYIAISQNEEGRVVSVKEDDVIETVERMSKENEEEKGILRDENVGGNVAVDDDDWEGIERSELEKVFAEAVNYVECGGKMKDEQLVSLGSDVQMQLYGLHKLALEGPCHEPQPMALKVSARAKWNAWRKLGSMNPEVAMEEYIKLLSDKDPGWMQHPSAEDYKHGCLEAGVCGSSDAKPSSLQDPQDNFEVGMMKKEKAD